eukprot:COSAG01_NODE_2158_length_8251_cov_8.554645_9_plen_77_part_00
MHQCTTSPHLRDIMIGIGRFGLTEIYLQTCSRAPSFSSSDRTKPTDDSILPVPHDMAARCAFGRCRLRPSWPRCRR